MSRCKRILKAIVKAAAVMAVLIAIGFVVTLAFSAVDYFLGPWGVLGAVALVGFIIVAIFEYKIPD